jgi:hypothetical protein
MSPGIVRLNHFAQGATFEKVEKGAQTGAGGCGHLQIARYVEALIVATDMWSEAKPLCWQHGNEEEDNEDAKTGRQ